MKIKEKHKDLKKKVTVAEQQRSSKRGPKSWYDLRTLKKLKLAMKDKLSKEKKTVKKLKPKVKKRSKNIKKIKINKVEAQRQDAEIQERQKEQRLEEDEKIKKKEKMTLKINSLAPDFTAETSEGKLSLHTWLGDSWGVLFSHPKDFTPVCTTELGALAKLKPEFEKRNVKVMGLSVDPVSDHIKWLDDIKDVCGLKPNYPIVADEKLEIAKLYNMLEDDAGATSMGRTAVDNQTVRTVYVIRPDKRIGLFLTYPMTTGRNFHEILRAIDSMQLTAKHKVATPADWKKGEDVIIVPSVTNEEAKKIYPDGWKTIKPYLRKVPDPSK